MSSIGKWEGRDYSYSILQKGRITRHSLEQAQIRFRQTDVLMMAPTAKMWLRKPEGNPQKKVTDQGLQARWCLRPLKVYCSLNATPLGLGDQWKSAIFSQERHTHLQPSATKNKLRQDFVSERSGEQLLPSTTRLGLGWDYPPSA